MHLQILKRISNITKREQIPTEATITQSSIHQKDSTEEFLSAPSKSFKGDETPECTIIKVLDLSQKPKCILFPIQPTPRTLTPLIRKAFLAHKFRIVALIHQNLYLRPIIFRVDPQQRRRSSNLDTYHPYLFWAPFLLESSLIGGGCVGVVKFFPRGQLNIPFYHLA